MGSIYEKRDRPTSHTRDSHEAGPAVQEGHAVRSDPTGNEVGILDGSTGSFAQRGEVELEWIQKSKDRQPLPEGGGRLVGADEEVDFVDGKEVLGRRRQRRGIEVIVAESEGGR